MLYHGIELDLPQGKVSFTHSIALDMIQGESSSKNIDWTSMLGDMPWGILKDEFTDSFTRTSELFSLLHLNYQVCNGGIEQYFYNRYHEERAAHHEDDLELYDIEVQKNAFDHLVKFARELFPDRVQENDALEAASNAFNKLSFEEDAPSVETIYCEEDEYIYDEETGEDIPNPDYFEPYDETTYEDVIHGESGFNDIFYQATEYLEEIMEIRAQYYCKLLSRDVEARAEERPDAAMAVRQAMTPGDYDAPSVHEEKLPLSQQIDSASSRAGDVSHGSNERSKEL